MTVKTQHAEYLKMKRKWDRCMHAACGQDAIHEMGELYLPRLLKQEDEEYKAYRNRALFYNATWRTIVGLQGMIFRRPPEWTVPDTVKDMMENVDLRGANLHMFALECVEETLKLGRIGIFTDYPKSAPGLTLADAQKLNLRPSLSMYTAQSIINWKTRTVGNKTMLSLVVLVEEVDEALDEFSDVCKKQYRVLDLTPMTVDLGVVKDVYRVRVMNVVPDPTVQGGERDNVISEDYPKINGKFLEEIPFQFVGVDDNSWEIDEPPMIDLVDVNIAHYRVSADYEHGCHFTGLPTPVISGYVKGQDADTFSIGSSEAWVFANSQAKASYLEFTGQGLGALEKNLEKKEGFMAVLGARMLEAQQTGHVEAADTVALRRGGEQSILASVAQAISIGICNALKTFCRFANAADDKVTFSLNRDFFPVPMDSLELTAYVAAWQNQAISYDTLYAKLKRADVVNFQGTMAEELQKIKDNPPPVMDTQTPTTPGNVKKAQGDAAAKGPKMKNSAATMAPTQTQLQKGKV